MPRTSATGWHPSWNVPGWCHSGGSRPRPGPRPAGRAAGRYAPGPNRRASPSQRTAGCPPASSRSTRRRTAAKSPGAAESGSLLAGASPLLTGLALDAAALAIPRNVGLSAEEIEPELRSARSLRWTPGGAHRRRARFQCRLSPSPVLCGTCAARSTSTYGYFRSIKAFRRSRSGASRALTPSALTSATMTSPTSSWTSL
jgi:hypothetical protein